MTCPFCSSDDIKVLETRAEPANGGTRRRRKCGQCGEAFYTLETLDATPLVVVDRTGQRLPFDREVLIGSLAVAGAASLSPNRRQQIADRVIGQLFGKGPVITSQEIGNTVLAILMPVDVLTFARYALAFTHPKDPEVFLKWLEHELARKSPGSPLSEVVILRKDGSRELFDRQTVETSVRQAVKSADINLTEVATLVTHISNDVHDIAKERADHSLTSGEIGNLVLDRLRTVSPIAYLNYAITVKELDTFPRLLGEIWELSHNTSAPRKAGNHE